VRHARIQVEAAWNAGKVGVGLKRPSETQAAYESYMPTMPRT
jgi:hypothetical protein